MNPVEVALAAIDRFDLSPGLATQEFEAKLIRYARAGGLLEFLVIQEASESPIAWDVMRAMITAHALHHRLMSAPLQDFAIKSETGDWKRPKAKPGPPQFDNLALDAAIWAAIDALREHGINPTANDGKGTDESGCGYVSVALSERGFNLEARAVETRLRRMKSRYSLKLSM